MGFLSKFENTMEDGIEGAAGAVGRGGLTPVQITKKAEKQMRRERIVGAGKQYAPTLYTVLVSPVDDRKLFKYYPTLAGETETYLLARAREMGYAMDGQPLVRFITDPELKRGKFDVVAEMVASAIIEQLREDEMERYGISNGRRRPNAAVQAARRGQAQPNMKPLPVHKGVVPAPMRESIVGDDEPAMVREGSREIGRAERAENDSMQFERLQHEHLASQPVTPQAYASQAQAAAAAASRAQGVAGEAYVQDAAASELRDNAYGDAYGDDRYGDAHSDGAYDDAYDGAGYSDAYQDGATLQDDSYSDPSYRDEYQSDAYGDGTYGDAAYRDEPYNNEPYSARSDANYQGMPYDNAGFDGEMGVAETVDFSQRNARVSEAYLYDEARDVAYQLTGARQRIGRESANDIVVPDINISRVHAEISCEPNGVWVLTDLNSTNGVFINGRKIDKAPLRDADMITLGTTTLEFQQF